MKNKKSINVINIPGVWPICLISGIIAIMLCIFYKTLLWSIFFASLSSISSLCYNFAYRSFSEYLLFKKI